jgi:hypothetical protein
MATRAPECSASGNSNSGFKMLKELALTAALATVVIHHVWGYSWLWSVPVFIGFFIATQAYRMLIYERFVSPLTKLPGPGVSPIAIRR